MNVFDYVATKAFPESLPRAAVTKPLCHANPELASMNSSYLPVLNDVVENCLVFKMGETCTGFNSRKAALGVILGS